MKARARAGVSLVEALVALTALSIGLVSLGGAATAASTLLRRAALEQGAAREAVLLMDSLAWLSSPGSGAVTRGAYTLSWTGTDSAGLGDVVIRVEFRAGEAARTEQFRARTMAPLRRADAP